MKKIWYSFMAAALIWAILFVSSCGKREETNTVTPTDTAVASSETVSSEEEVHGHRWEPADSVINGVSFGMTPDQAVERLGQPKRQTKASANEIHGAFISMDYDGGLTLWFNEQSDSKEYLLDEMYLSGEGLLLGNGVHVGNTLEEVYEAFDHPDRSFTDIETADHLLLYCNSDVEPEYVWDEEWPDEILQTGYYENYNNTTAALQYRYFEKPIWNEDKTSLTVLEYNLMFRNNPGEKTVSEINISRYLHTFSKDDEAV